VIGTRAKACTTIILLACCRCAFALNPSLDINQYAHNAWTVRDGFFKGTITPIAQTSDGYLWLGTEFGLVRFDGVRFVPWQPPAGEHLPGGHIRSLLVSRDGHLWIGTSGGLASWKDGKLTRYPELAGEDALTLLEDREGTIWMGGVGPNRKLCEIQSGHATCHGEDGSFGRVVNTLYEDSRGNLWVGAFTGLWRWKPGPPKFYPMDSVSALTKSDNGALLISTQGGIRQLVDGKAEGYSAPGAWRQFRPTSLLRDRNGGLWIGTQDRGLLHVHEGRTDLFAQTDGLSGDHIERLFEDSEGNIWVATLDGLDRFRDYAVPTISVKQGLSNGGVWSALAAADGSIWLGTADGLNGWKNGQITIYRKGDSGLPDDAMQSLFQDDRERIWVSTQRGIAYLENGRFVHVRGVPGGLVYSITADRAGNLWISHDDKGLFHLVGGSVVEQIPWARLQRKDVALSLLIDPVQGGLWLGFGRGGGVAYFKDGQVRASYATADGLGEGRVEDLRLDRDDTLWAATERGLSRVKNGRVSTLTSKNGLPCDTVHWAMEDDDHSFWLYTACGLVRIARPELDAWIGDPKRTIQGMVFDSSDGVRSQSATASYSPTVAKSADGKIWFLPFDGVSVIDPRHLFFNKLPPPVHIEQITADRKTYDATSNLRLPALTRDLEIDYTALSLVAPEKNRFKYKLEGYDRDWQDVGNRRQAFYGNLSPRNYRFRVIASNNNGVWNEAGASLDFSIAAAYYQTRWFLAACVAAFLVLLWALYRFRLHQISREFNVRVEERVGERTRIARDLHDTLLQSLAGVSLQLDGFSKQALRDGAPSTSISMIGRIREQVDSAFREARSKVWNLRSTSLDGQGLEGALRQLVAGIGPVMKAHCSVTVTGRPRPCPPEIEEELLRIAQEAANNANRHAEATEIRIALGYGAGSLRLSISDNGRGFDFDQGYSKSGHWGLKNMQERAALIRGKYKITTAVGQGTEIEVQVPLSSRFSRNTLAKHAHTSSGSR
jgi:signal transduction histidine kinase/ligand-binding sensor domain-containing protein